jgi:hypothetical protein
MLNFTLDKVDDRLNTFRDTSGNSTPCTVLKVNELEFTRVEVPEDNFLYLVLAQKVSNRQVGTSGGSEGGVSSSNLFECRCSAIEHAGVTIVSNG